LLLVSTSFDSSLKITEPVSRLVILTLELVYPLQVPHFMFSLFFILCLLCPSGTV